MASVWRVIVGRSPNVRSVRIDDDQEESRRRTANSCPLTKEPSTQTKFHTLESLGPCSLGGAGVRSFEFVRVVNRVLVVGCSGAGKTTLASRISERTGLTFIPTDPLYWNSDWSPVPDDVVAGRIMERIRESTWVMDGNFVDQRIHVWGRADTVIWLDLSFGRVMSRILRRNLGWWLKRDVGWAERPISFGRVWSGIRHTIWSHRVKRITYPGHLENFSHLNVVRLRTPNEVRLWLASLGTTLKIPER